MEIIPNLERLWSDLVQEEIKRYTKDGTSSREKDEENFSLVGNKGKGKKIQRKPKSNQNNGKKKDLSKIKCFHYHEYGHYATKFFNKKSNKDPSRGAGGEALDSQFELDFTLLACIANTVMSSVWYLDFSASFHMTECKEYFSGLEEKDLHMHI